LECQFRPDLWLQGEKETLMQPGSPEHVNLRLDKAQWIETDADRVYFAKLVAEISGWERPGEKLNIADIAEPFAWRKNYALLEALKRRGLDKAVVQAAEDGRTMAAVSRRMGEFAADRQGLIHFRDRNRPQWADLSEYVGISDADLVEGPRDERFDVEVGWQDKAERLAHALRRLEGMSPAEKADAHRVVEERRRLAILKGHDKDIANLFDVVRQLAQANEALQQKVAALESRLPSQAEVRADAAA
jgi:hypothetical protein